MDFDSADLLLREQLKKQEKGANFLSYYDKHVSYFERTTDNWTSDWIFSRS